MSYIAANACPEDWTELECQVSAETKPDRLGAFHLSASSEAWVATLDGQPVQAFGVIKETVSVVTLWAYGTTRRRRAVPAVSRFIRAQAPRWFAEGITRGQARAMASHPTAGRWLRGLGAAETPLPCWGRDGQDFTLFSWTRDQWHAHR